MVVAGALIGAGVAAAVLFPPAVMAVAVLATQRHQAESSDLIIAVEGTRDLGKGQGIALDFGLPARNRVGPRAYELILPLTPVHRVR
jgi:hypothetical protein